MADQIRDAIEKIDSIRSTLSTFQRNNRPSLLEHALESIEELHDDIEDILEEDEDSDDER